MRVAFAGGGTGGHLFPGLAVAELANANGVASQIVFFGANRGIEARAVPAAGFEFFGQDLTGAVGSGPIGALRSVVRTVKASLVARAELRRRKVDVVVGLGSYASTAGMAGAMLAGIPLVVLEQNRHPGVANRFFGRRARAVCVSFESSRADFPDGVSHLTGNPIRSAMGAISAFGSSRDTLLVFGGSGGARSLNCAVVEALALLAARGPLPPVIHQSGRAMETELRALYAEAGLETAVSVRPFIDDMAAVYATTRLAVCRAGATSIAELAVTGTPSVMVPLATSAGGHQMENALAVESEGAAVVVPDREGCAQELATVIEALLSDALRLESMSASALSLGRPDAAAQVLAVIAKVAGQA
ncbi:MAG: UDP-N-acetylglucosamine--N-acetylmuramyl-(pentapeptide) pyrophosphoryl-undecaprenol N-acetylglucosamine transferase [Hyphomicrobiaceae bacterium]|jgi:UDP-N-acetylglucosamine--N-acetylmuramyl-(pentapeptide) pyrophosphoryl-undecaprenol N-acetylglucosamine transferase